MKHTHLFLRSAKKGFLTIFVLVASSIFLFLLSELMGSIAIERGAQATGSQKEKAFHFSEAGLEYYRWHFSAFPSDLQDGTGVTGPYQHTVKDPVSNIDDGAFSLSITGDTYCSTVTSALVKSTGWSLSSPTQTKKITARIAKPSVATLTTPATTDASAIASSLPTLKGYAQSTGVYVAPSGNGKFGYRVVLKNNGTIDVAPVTATTRVWGYSVENGWVREDSVISAGGATVNYSIPTNCPVVYVEDTIWLEGVTNNKVTVVSADIVNAGVAPSVYITGNLTYANTYDDALTVIAEKSILISLDSPDVLTIKGVFVPGSGYFGRHRYDASGSHQVPGVFSSSVTRSTLNTFGTLVSNGAITTKWISDGTFISGYSTRNDTHDPFLAALPAPFTPTSSNNFRFTNWRVEE